MELFLIQDQLQFCQGMALGLSKSFQKIPGCF